MPQKHFGSKVREGIRFTLRIWLVRAPYSGVTPPPFNFMDQILAEKSHRLGGHPSLSLRSTKEQLMMIEKTLASLLSRSSVFDAMLDKNMRESQVGEVDILDVEPETLKQMLEFIYTGQVLGILLHK